jgi:hypothetical protein
MWCSSCQQDVAPAAAADAAQPLRCKRCGEEMAESHLPTSRTCAAKPATLPLADDWELEADLRGVERMIFAFKSRASSPESPLAEDDGPSVSRCATARPHAAHDGITGWHAGGEPKPAKSNPLAWTILSLGLATFACGAVLLGWSFAAERDDLWPLGLPLALIGQAGLIVGLVLQIDGLWHSNRQTADTLSGLDEELTRVRRATTLLTKSNSAATRSLRELWVE